MNDIAIGKPEDLGKGERRLDPVDVDVLDNLINAKAAYMEAVSVAYEHFGLETPSDEITQPLLDAMSRVSGAVLLGVAAERL